MSCHEKSTGNPIRLATPFRLSVRCCKLEPFVLAGLAVLGYIWIGLGLPRIAWLSSDSPSYLQFSPVRPHGYSLFLAAYRLISPDYRYLPHTQLGLYVGAVLFLAFAVRARTSNFFAGVLVLIVTLSVADTTIFPYILSDPLYSAAITTSVAAFIMYADSSRPWFLFLASAGVGIALCSRAIALAVLPSFVLAVVLQIIKRPVGLARTATIAAVPIIFLCLIGASSQLVHNGRFVLGNWGGIDVLGKIPLLSRSPQAEVGRLDDLIDAMTPAREKLRHLSPAIEALAARQYYEFLRWSVIVPEFERSWPAWRDGDDYRRGQLAAELAQSYIAQDPLGFLNRTVVDLTGLWLMPRWLTRTEYDAAIAEIDSIGKLPSLSSTETGLDYYKIVPDPISPIKVALFRCVVLCFWLLSIGFVAFVLWRPVIAVIAPDLVLILAAVHTSYLGTAMMEGTYARYIMPTWPTLVAGPALAVGLAWRYRRTMSYR